MDDIEKFLDIDTKSAQIIKNLYDYAETLNNKVMLSYRSGKNRIVGVGIPGEYLRFYFFIRDGEIHIKFKTNPKIFSLYDNIEVLKDQIKSTDYIFNQGNFQLSNRTDNHANVNMSRFEYLTKIANGIDPISGELLFQPDLETKTILCNLALFVLKKDKQNKSKFRITKDLGLIETECNQLLERYRKDN